jgi:hypothetical protein
MAGGLRGERVGDGVAGAFLLLDPGKAGHSDPDGAVVDVKTDVDSVGMAGGDGDDVGLPAAVQHFSAPAVGGVEIFVHGLFSVEHFWPRRIRMMQITETEGFSGSGSGRVDREINMGKWQKKNKSSGGLCVQCMSERPTSPYPRSFICDQSIAEP